MYPVVFGENFPLVLLGCFCCSFVLSALGVRLLIHFLGKLGKFQPIRIEGPESHQNKVGIPTMAGIAVSLSMALNILLFCDIKSPPTMVALYLIAVFSAIGLADDAIKVFYGDTRGFRGSKKLILQLFFTALGLIYLGYRNPEYIRAELLVPLSNSRISLASLTPLFWMLIICGSANATNMTDGLDGLLAVPVIVISATFMVMLMAPGSREYFYSALDPDMMSDLVVILLSMLASFAGFFIYNAHPAKIFLGDVGSLMVGALLCYIAILMGVELFYALSALLFIFEILSTMLQVGYFKITHGKKLFKMSPFHHHLEKSGMAEKDIVTSLWLFNVLCSFLALVLFHFTSGKS
jgi:phospho-N-acetylmuramoyl-pentapeptide-transferase